MSRLGFARRIELEIAALVARHPRERTEHRMARVKSPLGRKHQGQKRFFSLEGNA
jgi:hypothetical protein